MIKCSDEKPEGEKKPTAEKQEKCYITFFAIIGLAINFQFCFHIKIWNNGKWSKTLQQNTYVRLKKGDASILKHAQL